MDKKTNPPRKNPLSFLGWHQAPLSEHELTSLRYDQCRGMSIRTKITMLLTIALSVFAFASTVISYNVYMETSIAQNERLATGIANLVAENVDAAKIDEYIESKGTADGYDDTLRKLYHIRDSSPLVEYLYVYRITEEGCQVVFDLDTPDMEAVAPGVIIPFDNALGQYKHILLSGGKIPPVISNEEFGWLLTVLSPIYDSKGICRGYAGIDISMEHIHSQAREFIFKLSVVFVLILVIILFIAFWMAKYNIILPINTMAHSAGIFAYNSEEALEKSLERISKLNIRTGDEVENLYRSFVKMTHDSVRYMTDIKNKNETIAKMQTALIMTLADMVERRDKNTGHHIRKTAAYVKIIAEGMKETGVYNDILTDDLIHNMVESAPLHDVGKITIPDAILNKPGRLTDEEFDLMKTHTSAGGKIIGSLIDTVPDSDYLYEARNLATYHHERWDGRGYPSGLAGEAIPLSSRIMAVADVFDALISNRSYKKGFPYEKALAIIKAESGTHFDPQVVTAFFAEKDKILEVADEFSEMEE